MQEKAAEDNAAGAADAANTSTDGGNTGNNDAEEPGKKQERAELVAYIKRFHAAHAHTFEQWTPFNNARIGFDKFNELDVDFCKAHGNGNFLHRSLNNSAGPAEDVGDKSTGHDLVVGHIQCALCYRPDTFAQCHQCNRRCCRRCLEPSGEVEGGWWCKACWGVDIDKVSAKIDVDKIDEAAMLQVRFALQGELTEEPELDALADPSLRNSAEVSVKYGDEGDDEDDKDGDADGEEDCPPAKR